MSDRRPPGLAGTEGLARATVFSALLASVKLSERPGGVLEGPNVVLPGYRRLFGGQLLAQALSAAAASETSGKRPRSLHLVFSAEGLPEEPVSWSVEILHDGRSFATRGVRAMQGARLLASGLVSLHTAADEGPEHFIAPPLLQDPSDLDPVPQIGAMALELRCQGGVALDGLATGPPELAVWMRRPAGAAGPPRAARAAAEPGERGDPGDPGQDEQILAYSSDLTMMAAALRPHAGLGFGSPALLASAVTSHTISFHRPISLSTWLLFAQCAPVAAGGRAYIRGDWFTAAGELVASCAQEVSLRVAGRGS